MDGWVERVCGWRGWVREGGRGCVGVEGGLGKVGDVAG